MQAFVMDRDAIMARLGDDEEILALMIDMFLQDYENNCTQLNAAWQAGEAPVLMREAHTIKGLLATMSDDLGAELAHAIEQKAKLGDIAALAPAIEELIARMRDVARVLGQG